MRLYTVGEGASALGSCERAGDDLVANLPKRGRAGVGFGSSAARGWTKEGAGGSEGLGERGPEPRCWRCIRTVNPLLDDDDDDGSLSAGSICRGDCYRLLS